MMCVWFEGLVSHHCWWGRDSAEDLSVCRFAGVYIISTALLSKLFHLLTINKVPAGWAGQEYLVLIFRGLIQLCWAPPSTDFGFLVHTLLLCQCCPSSHWSPPIHFIILFFPPEVLCCTVFFLLFNCTVFLCIFNNFSLYLYLFISPFPRHIVVTVQCFLSPDLLLVLPSWLVNNADCRL